MSDRIESKDFREEINKFLEDYGAEVADLAVSAADDTAKEAKNRLRMSSTGSFKDRTGSYRKGWRAVLHKTRTSVQAQVYNATDYQLTHLLEFGFVSRYGNRVPGHPHIAEVNDWAARAFEDALQKGVEKISK